MRYSSLVLRFINFFKLKYSFSHKSDPLMIIPVIGIIVEKLNISKIAPINDKKTNRFMEFFLFFFK